MPPLDSPGAVRRRATSAYVAGVSLQTTFVFFLAPTALAMQDLVQAGSWVFMTAALATAGAVVPAGALADRWTRRTVMTIGAGLVTAGYVVMAVFGDALPVLVLVAALMGASVAALVVAFNAYVADVISREGASKAYGRTGALGVLASALGPLVAAAMMAVWGGEAGLRRAAGVLALVALAATVAVAGLPTARRDRIRPALQLKSNGRSAVGPIAIMNVLVGMGTGLAAPYYALFFMRNLGWTPPAWGILLTVATWAGAAGIWLSGHLAHGVRPRTLILGAQSLRFVMTLLFVAPIAPLVLAVAYVLRTMFANSVAPLTSTILMSRAAAAVRGQELGWTQLAWNLGWAVGAALGGTLLVRLGPGVFAVGGFLAVAGAVAGISVLEGKFLARPLRPSAQSQPKRPGRGRSQHEGQHDT